MSKLVLFPSIGSLMDVRKTVGKFNSIAFERNGVVEYRPKTKINGENASIAKVDGQTFLQSRTRLVNRSADLNGFAIFCENNQSSINSWADNMVYYGEWAGKGIKPGQAYSSVDKFFAIFAVRDIKNSKWIIDPEQIANLISTTQNVFILPWEAQSVSVKILGLDAEFDEIVNIANKMTDATETEDPWSKRTFGISGVGEGYVFYPVNGDLVYFDNLDEPNMSWDRYSDLCFKAKNMKHRQVMIKQATQIAPEVISSAEEFAQRYATSERFEEIVFKNRIEIEKSNLGKFMGLAVQDINKECQVELEASGIEWKLVSHKASDIARKWFLGKWAKFE